MTKLVISEKANAARRIAEILSGGDYETQEVGSVPVHEFPRDGETWRVVGLSGHIVNLDYPDEYNESWFRHEPRELIEVAPEKELSREEFADALDKVRQGVDELIVATDYDREGELIGLETVEYLRDKIDAPVRRARFSALTDDEVLDAFDNLTELDVDLARSAEARQHIDLAWGATLTRFVSISSSSVGDDFLSVGRVQSPTLALVVDKEKEIEEFDPTPYWELHGRFAKDDAEFEGEHVEGRFWDEDEADAILEAIGGVDEATVTDVDERTRKKKAPTPFNTTSYIRAATKQNLSASQAMSVAEELYNNGYISYPRTDNTVYPDSLDIEDLLDTLKGGPFAGEAQELLEQDELDPREGDSSSTDHPPIHPAAVATEDELSDRQWKVYELVVRRFLATLAPPAVEQSLKVTLDVDGEDFEGKGYRILKPGWRKYYPYKKKRQIRLPEMEEGDPVEVRELIKEDKETQPPRRYSQGGLVEKMEEHNLGTKSTRHEIISKLMRRGYLSGGSGLQPTHSGRALIEALQSHADQVASPDMTAQLEEDMGRVAEGEIGLDDVVEESREMLDTVFDDLEEHQDEIGDRMKDALREQSKIGECPECGEDLVIRRSRSGSQFVGCTGYNEEPRCENTYPLPQDGKIEPTRETCPHCGLGTFKVIRAGRRPWETCLDMDCPGPHADEDEVEAAQEG